MTVDLTRRLAEAAAVLQQAQEREREAHEAYLDARRQTAEAQEAAVELYRELGAILHNRDARTESGKRYRMGRGSPNRYNDIAWVEIPEDEFDLHDAWVRYVEPVVEYNTDRAGENFRRAIRLDTERFEVSEDMRRARKKREGVTHGDLA